MGCTRWRTLLAASQAVKELGRRELVRACHQTHSGGRQMIQERAVRCRAEAQMRRSSERGSECGENS